MINLLITILLFVNIPSEPTGLKVGDKAPSFVAIDQNGKKITLEESLKQGKVILTFYRGAWCKYCMQQFKNYQDSLVLINEKGANLIAVAPEHEDGVAKSVKVSGATFSILHDDQLTIMQAYDVISPEKVEKYKSEFAATGEDNQEKYLPVPATYIINQQGIIEYVYFDPNYKVRVHISDLLNEL